MSSWFIKLSESLSLNRSNNFIIPEIIENIDFFLIIDFISSISSDFNSKSDILKYFINQSTFFSKSFSF